jgi:hypothetical protein
MSSLRLWVSDSLHEVANISDSTIADFFIDLASKSSSPDDLVSTKSLASMTSQAQSLSR